MLLLLLFSSVILVPAVGTKAELEHWKGKPWAIHSSRLFQWRVSKINSSSTLFRDFKTTPPNVGASRRLAPRLSSIIFRFRAPVLFLWWWRSTSCRLGALLGSPPINHEGCWNARPAPKELGDSKCGHHKQQRQQQFYARLLRSKTGKPQTAHSATTAII